KWFMKSYQVGRATPIGPAEQAGRTGFSTPSSRRKKMDRTVYCSNCGEPWEANYLWHDLILLAGFTLQKAKLWRALSSSDKLSEAYRKRFKVLGWEFGTTLNSVVRCPCCPVWWPRPGRWNT